MPDPLNVNTQSGWPAGSLPPQTSSGGGTRVKQYQNGWKTRHTEPKGQVLPYTSIRYMGTRTRYQPHPIYGSWISPVGFTSSTPYFGAEWGGGNPGFAAIQRNRCYDKFKEKALGDTASIGAFIAEGRESMGLIADRALGLYHGYKSLRKGNFKGFLKALSTDPKSKHKSKRKVAASEVSGLWLEYWFAWAPSVADMYTAMDVLNSNLKEERISAASGISFPERSTGDYPPPTSNARAKVDAECKVFWKTGATLRINNPNLLLASQLGLIDPIAIAWELVLFSFVADWFVKFGNVLSARTDFLGMSLIDPYIICFQKGTLRFTIWDRRAGTGNSGHYDYGIYQMVRTKGLISPVVLWPKLTNFGQSETRAATAVSLLTQIFLIK